MSNESIIASVEPMNPHYYQVAAHEIMQKTKGAIMPIGLRVIANIDRGAGIEIVPGIVVGMCEAVADEPFRCMIQAIDGKGGTVVCKPYSPLGGPIEANTFTVHALDVVAFLQISKAHVEAGNQLAQEALQEPQSENDDDQETKPPETGPVVVNATQQA